MIEVPITVREIDENYDNDGRLKTMTVTVGRRHRDGHKICFEFGYEDSVLLDAGEIHKRHHETPRHLHVTDDAVDLATKVREFAREIAEQRWNESSVGPTTSTIEISRQVASSSEIENDEGILQ
jgi:hypothetical protein